MIKQKTEFRIIYLHFKNYFDLELQNQHIHRPTYETKTLEINEKNRNIVLFKTKKTLLYNLKSKIKH